MVILHFKYLFLLRTYIPEHKNIVSSFWYFVQGVKMQYHMKSYRKAFNEA